MPVSFEAALDRAASLRAEAVKIEEDAVKGRPLPDKWQTGQQVRYLESREWAWTRGRTGFVVQLREEYAEAAGDEYQVFYTGPNFPPKNGDPIYWTTPADVELVEDHE